jgi:hypothetical protein
MGAEFGAGMLGAESSARRAGSVPTPALAPERSTGASAGVGTEPARLALIPAPVLALNPAPIPVFRSTPILVQTAARPVALAPLAPAPLARLAALPGALVEVLANYWSQAMMVALLVLLLLAIVLIGKGPRRPKTHFGPV